MTLRTGRNLIAEARVLAEDLWASDESRWQHTQGVAARATSAVAANEAPDRPVLVTAAYLHDIGYAQPLRQSGFHPLDGACFLQQQGWPALVVGLVAHHSGARFVADARGLSVELKAFDDERFVSGPLADAVTYADQTSGPNGSVIDVETRIAEMLRRHGPDSPNARCHPLRAPVLRAAVAATENRLRTAT